MFSEALPYSLKPATIFHGPVSNYSPINSYTSGREKSEEETK